MAKAQTTTGTTTKGRAAAAPPQNLKPHGSWSKEKAQEEYDESQASGSGADFFKPKTGKNVLRFLPPAAGKETPFEVVHQHYIEMPGSQKAVSFTCPRMHKQGRCPACEQAQKLRDTGNPADYERAGKLMARRRVFANVIDRTDPERGPVIFPFGKTVHEQLLALRGNEESGGDFTDPGPEGFDITVEKTGEGLKTEYKVFAARKNSALGNDEWLEQMHDLTRLGRCETYDEIRKKMGDDSAGSPPAARVAAGRGRAAAPAAQPPKGRRTAEDDAEEQEEDEEEQE